MHVTLMHNPKAGSGNPSRKALVTQLERVGHKVASYSTKDKDFIRGLDSPGDLVVIAGGDGTVRKVALRLLGRNVPIAILPLGTANNIAKALGLDCTAKHLINNLSRARSVRFDVGVARGPWGDVPFLEAAGVGLFPRMMAAREANKEKGVTDPIDTHGGMKGGVHFLQQLLDQFRGRESSIRLDGKELTGKYLLVEALNIPSMGPSLELAPKAHPGDGVLDVVMIREDQRRKLRRHLDGSIAKRNNGAFVVHRARELKLSCSAAEFHFDDQCWPNPKKEKDSRKPMPGHIHAEIGVFPGALRVLVSE